MRLHGYRVRQTSVGLSACTLYKCLHPVAYYTISECVWDVGICKCMCTQSDYKLCSLALYPYTGRQNRSGESDQNLGKSFKK